MNGQMALVEQLIKAIDVDGDGCISKDELMSLAY